MRSRGALGLTVDQLKRAVALKEQIDKLNKELGSILGGAVTPAAAPKKTPAIGAAPAKTLTMSEAVKKKIAAT